MWDILICVHIDIGLWNILDAKIKNKKKGILTSEYLFSFHGPSPIVLYIRILCTDVCGVG